MRKSRFTEEQMVAILREADRTSVGEAAKKHTVSEPTIYAWRKQFGKLEVQDVKRLKESLIYSVLAARTWFASVDSNPSRPASTLFSRRTIPRSTFRTH